MKANSRVPFRLQLTRQYATSFLFLLLALGVVTYFSLSQTLLQNLDRGLLLIAQSEADFATHNQKLHLHRTRDVLPGASNYSLPRFVQITDLKGRIVAENHGQTLSPFTLEPQQLRANEMDQTVLVRTWLNDQPYRLLYLPISKSGTRYSLQVATPLAPVRDTLTQVMTVYVLSSLLILVLASWLGWRLAQRAVAPLEEIAAISDRIDVQQLSERIPESLAASQELHELTHKLNRMLARLEMSTQALQQFTADASHELRTPLTVLKGEIQIALRKPRSVAEYHELLESNLEEVNRLIQLAEALLTLSRLEQQSSSGQLLRGETELIELVKQLTERWRESAQRQAVELVLEHPSQPLWTAVHPRYLEQVLYNLLDNALRVSPRDSQLGLKVSASGEKVCLAVSDQGPGIAPEHQLRVFERFFQVDAARTGNHGHFGIGLSLCKTMIEVHGGCIELNSELGRGSTFRVILNRLNQTEISEPARQAKVGKAQRARD